jgi:hypothetical protein
VRGDSLEGPPDCDLYDYLTIRDNSAIVANGTGSVLCFSNLALKRPTATIARRGYRTHGACSSFRSGQRRSQ